MQKILNTPNHQRNAKQNHNEMISHSLHSSKKGYYQKDQDVKKKRALEHCW
jgi:hypothetical protein